jgi:hypothetical protein
VRGRGWPSRELVDFAHDDPYGRTLCSATKVRRVLACALAHSQLP